MIEEIVLNNCLDKAEKWRNVGRYAICGKPARYRESLMVQAGKGLLGKVKLFSGSRLKMGGNMKHRGIIAALVVGAFLWVGCNSAFAVDL